MKTLTMTSVIALGLLIAVGLSPVAAQDCGCEAGDGCAAGDCCGNCGRGKVCRLVKKEKEVKTTCYGTKCKDICIASCRNGCQKSECVKAGKCSCDGCETAGQCKTTHSGGKPARAKVRTVNQLVKYQVTKKVCVWEWEVQDAGCGDGCCAGNGCACGCGAGNGCASGAADGCGCAAAPGCSCAEATTVRPSVQVVKRAGRATRSAGRVTSRGTVETARRVIDVAVPR